MSIPFEIKRAGESLPPTGLGLRYIAAQNGYFLERKNDMYHSVSRVDHCGAGLVPHRASLELKTPPIPDELARPMVEFFRWAFEFHGGEAALVLLYDPANREYHWHCPEQRVELYESWGGAWYPRGDIEYTDPLEIPSGLVVFGDAHSHGDLGAYASAVDKEDELHKDGLHIVIGRVTDAQVDISIEFVMDRTRFRVGAEDMLPSIAATNRSTRKPETAKDAFPEEWRSCVEVIRSEYTPLPPYSGGTSSYGYGSSDRGGSYFKDEGGR